MTNETLETEDTKTGGKKRRGPGRPPGTGKRQKEAAESERIQDIRAEEQLRAKPRLRVPEFAAPRADADGELPKIKKWPARLKKMFKRNGLMLKDFGLSKSQVTIYAENAAAGDESAAERLEPIKQVLLDMMGRDIHRRRIQIRDPENHDRLTYKLEPDPMTPGQMRIATEPRSRWASRESDMIGNRGKPPTPRVWLKLINRDFYKLVHLLEWVDTTPKIPEHPNMPRHKAESIREDHKLKLDPDTNPLRELWLELLPPFLDGEQTSWNGLD